MLAHMVFFTLKDHSPAACQRMLEACRKYLAGHPGTIHFSAGMRAPQYQREVNDKDYHIALHLIFDSHASHDLYQAHAQHLQFVAENRDNWAKVRVFDSDLP